VPHAKRYYRGEAQPYLVVINSKGLRDKEHSYDKLPGVFRIVVLGDSIVFGAGGVMASDRFTDIMERSTSKIEVVNMGMPAFGTDQEYLYLQTEGLKYHPDLVIFCTSSSDFGEAFSTIGTNGRPKGYFSQTAGRLVFHPPVISVFYGLMQHSYLLAASDLVLTRVSGTHQRASQQPRDILDLPARVMIHKLLYASARELCRQQQAEFVLVYLPSPGQNTKWIIQQIMDQLAATEATNTLDLMDIMLHANAARPAYFEHDIHLNEHGHQVVANMLLEYLQSSRLLKPVGQMSTR
jgi:hypothetical protein